MATILTTTVVGAQKYAEAFRAAIPNVEFALLIEELADDPDNPGVGELSPVSTWADRGDGTPITEAAWTGYARVSKALPVPVDGAFIIITDVGWSTGAAVDGPAAVGTIAVLDPADDEPLAFYNADYYLSGPTPVAMNVANAVITVVQPIVLFVAPLPRLSP